jgi:hypothetical protein
MFQKKTLGILFVTAFVLISVAYAGKVELTTYYPAPFGEYEDLQTNTMKYNTLKATRMAVAQTNNDAQLDAADQPNRDGDIRLGAQGGDPRTWPAGAGGQIAFSANEGALYLYNGSAWVAAGGGGGDGFQVMGYATCHWSFGYPIQSCGITTKTSGGIDYMTKSSACPTCTLTLSCNNGSRLVKTASTDYNSSAPGVVGDDFYQCVM